MEQQSQQEEALIIIKPNIFNALVPILAKNIIFALVLGAVAFGLYWLLNTFGTIDYPMSQVILWVTLFVIIFPLIPFGIRLLILHNTKYFFYKTHVVAEFELLYVKRHSTPYNQIVNITSHVTIWDRLCNAGDLTMHTAEDRLPDLTLHYIKDPDGIENKIYELIRQFKTQESEHAEPVQEEKTKQD